MRTKRKTLSWQTIVCLSCLVVFSASVFAGSDFDPTKAKRERMDAYWKTHPVSPPTKSDEEDYFHPNMMCINADSIVVFPPGLTKVYFNMGVWPGGPLENCIDSILKDGVVVYPVNQADIVGLTIEYDLLYWIMYHQVEEIEKSIPHDIFNFDPGKDVALPDTIVYKVVPRTDVYFNMHFLEWVNVFDYGIESQLEDLDCLKDVYPFPLAVQFTDTPERPPIVPIRVVSNMIELQWGFHATGDGCRSCTDSIYGCNITGAWAVTGRNVIWNNSPVVAVIDDGWGSCLHPELVHNMDPRSNPWFCNAHNQHGTWVSSVLSAGFSDYETALYRFRGEPDSQWVNGKGMIGSAFKSKVILKDKGYNYVAALTDLLYNYPDVRVWNISWGIFWDNPALRNLVIKAHYVYGVNIVAAGGNWSMFHPNIPPYPAAYPEVIAVAATTTWGSKWDRSLSGPQMDVAAPGSNILVAAYSEIPVPAGKSDCLYEDAPPPDEDYYSTASGTSLAAPHVAGIVANMLAANPSLTPATIMTYLLESTYGDGVWNEDFGYGIVNGREAVLSACTNCSQTINGDVNKDCLLNGGDVYSLINYMFFAGATPIGSPDMDGDCYVDISDLVYIVDYFFNNGPAPQESCFDPGGKGSMVKAPMPDLSTQNYPNPFNPKTTIQFDLPAASDWSVTVYNILGQKMEVFEGSSDAGLVSVEFDGRKFSSGVYLYRIVADGVATEAKKMVLLK